MSGFVDQAQMCAVGGDGGAGCVSFRREAHVAQGGPNGGDGGHGGDVWLVADRNVASLLAFRDHPHRRATSGGHGQGQRRHGRSGDDLEVHVPVGTTVRTLDGEVEADLAQEGDRWRAARGGQGGRGNARFLSNRLRAPRFSEQGEAGDERWFDLELRLFADVALVGFPNAGKSTLISRLSAAHPKIADYPFTTLEPQLGVVRNDEYEYVVADIPGLIEGASEGRGLGHQFLRHVERARVLVILVDLAPIDERTPGDQLATLLRELGRYRDELLERPRLVVGSKGDLLDAGTGTEFEGSGVELVISAVDGEGLDVLVGRLGEMVVAARAADDQTSSDEGFVIHRPEPEGLRVGRADNGDFVVEGRQARRAVALSDLTDPDALDYAWSRLRRMGLEQALESGGVTAGATVRIGDMAFEYQPDAPVAPEEDPR
jgi:GTP-binding protein